MNFPPYGPPPGFGPDPDPATGVPRGAIYQIREEEGKWPPGKQEDAEQEPEKEPESET